MFEALGFWDGVSAATGIILLVAAILVLWYIVLQEREKRIKREMREYMREYTRDNFKRE